MALAFSPDGGRLLFIRPVNGGPDEAGALYVLDPTVGHGTETLLTPPGVLVYADRYLGAGASWSPDGRRSPTPAPTRAGTTA